MEDKKNPLLSKTLWTNLIMAIGALFIPAVNEWMSQNVEMVALIWSGINMVLRLVTKQKLGLLD